jgi:hypothetical protein
MKSGVPYEKYPFYVHRFPNQTRTDFSTVFPSKINAWRFT